MAVITIEQMMLEGQSLWPRPIKVPSIRRLYERHKNGKLGNISLEDAWETRKRDHTEWWTNKFKDYAWHQYPKLFINWSYALSPNGVPIAFKLTHKLPAWRTSCVLSLQTLPANEQELVEYINSKIRQLAAIHECVLPNQLVIKPRQHLELLSNPEFVPNDYCTHCGTFCQQHKSFTN